METENKLPRLLLPKKPKDYREAGAYLLTLPDEFHKERIEFKGEDGKDYLLWTPASRSNDERRKNPSVGVVAKGYGNVDFEPGDTVLCEHHSFKQGGKRKVFYEKDGTEYFRVLNFQVHFKVDDSNNLIPRKNVLLCEPLKEKMVETSLHIPDEYIDYRRDVVKIVRTWEGCTQYTEGDFILLTTNADYPITHNNKRYVKVDTSSGHEVLAKVDSAEWRYKKIHRHVDHKLKSQK